MDVVTCKLCLLGACWALDPYLFAQGVDQRLQLRFARSERQDAAAVGKSPCLAAARGLSLEYLTRSVEAGNGIDGLQRKRKTLAMGGEIREYVMSHYMLPYARFNATIYRLSI